MSLAGRYRVNATGFSERSVYPPSVAEVVVHPEEDGYHDVTFYDADGNEVLTNNRGAHRVRGALMGGDGYDVLVKGA